MLAYLSGFLPAAAALSAVVALVLLAGRAVRGAGLARFGGSGRGGGRLSMQETLQLDRVRRLHLVRCDGRQLLLLTGGGADLVVGWLPEVLP